MEDNDDYNKNGETESILVSHDYVNVYFDDHFVTVQSITSIDF